MKQLKRVMLIAVVAVLALTLAACSSSQTKSVTGTVTDGTMNTVTIQTDDGTELTFSTMDADTSGLTDGLVIGNKITVNYTGDINGTDTSGATVVSLVAA